MNLLQFNNKVREILTGLVADGFTQHEISELTFGSNRQDQLKEFLSGRRISGKPLINMFNDLGFTVHIVPVNNADSAAVEKLNEITTDSLEALQMTFVNYLETKRDEKGKRKNIVFFVDFIIEQIHKKKKAKKT